MRMKQFVPVIVAAITTLTAAGCNRPPSEAPAGKDTLATPNQLTNPTLTTARGCLTGNGDQFVLTSTERASGADPVAPTQTYRLVGMTDQLKPLVGQRVEVSGDSVPSQVVDMVGATPSGAAGNASTATAGNDAKVTTASRARIEIHDLRVTTVNPLGDKCQ